MKKIGIFTGIGVYNYGTKLQAYAMQEIFRKRGFDSEILIRISVKRYFYSEIKAICKKLISIILPNFFDKRKYLGFISQCYGKQITLRLKKKLCKRLYAIDCFDKNYRIKVIEHSKLRNYSRIYDAAVCGSDQIWRPIDNPTLDWTTLQFVDENVRRFSYAPSLGVDKIPEEKKNFFRKVLSDLYSVSVREVSGAEILQELTDKKVHVVLDPTLLAGKKLWDKIIEEKKELTKKDYCLCYLLGTNSEHRKIVSEVARKQKLIIYNFSHFKKYNEADDLLEGIQLYDVTVGEFVGLISRAKYVVTDSFHCSAFAIMYHKPFLTLLRYESSDTMSTNSRIYSILGQLGLKSRIYNNKNDIDTYLLEKIDYQKVDEILSIKRKESNDFLDKTLSGL